jgi:D-glutamate N-acetyltransferase
MSDTLAIFAEGLFRTPNGKTGHGVIRYGQREVAAVIDSTLAGRRADEVIPYCAHPVPIVATVGEAAALGARRLLIGVAPSGGRLTPEWRVALADAMERGMDVEAGLHTELAEDHALRVMAERHRVSLHDLRLAPTDLGVPRGPAQRASGLRVVHSVGSNCAIGKMTVTLELERAARARGERAVFVATGQTGIAIAGWGIAVDHVISDYIAGAAERLVDQGAQRGDLLFVEGQGALFHPAYSGVTLGLLHGCLPDALVLCHRANEVANDEYPEVPIPPLAELARTYEAVASPLRPTRVAAIALNTRDLDDDAAQAAIVTVTEETGIVTDDPVRNGSERILDAVLAAL